MLLLGSAFLAGIVAGLAGGAAFLAKQLIQARKSTPAKEE